MTERKSTAAFRKTTSTFSLQGDLRSKVGADGQETLTVSAFFAQLERGVHFTTTRWGVDNQCTASDEFGTLVFGSSRTDNPLLNYVNVKRGSGGEDADLERVINLVIGLIDPDFVASGGPEVARAIKYMSSRAINDAPLVRFTGHVAKYTFRMDSNLLMMEAEHK